MEFVMAQSVRRASLLFLLPGVLLTSLGAADPLHRVFRSGGRVEMRLEAGEYDIQAGTGETISVSLSGALADQVRVKFDSTEAATRLAITRTPRHDFRAVIKVPASCDLVICHSAGDLEAKPFQTSKGGLFNSFRWNGHGKYHLNANLTAGDLILKNQNPVGPSRGLGGSKQTGFIR
jgi:hypothetical protein